MKIGMCVVLSLFYCANSLAIDESLLDPLPKTVEIADSDGYKYLYKTVRDGYDQTGIIETRDAAGNLMVRLTELPPSGPCEGQFSAPKNLSLPFMEKGERRVWEYTVLCGSDLGHRQTLFLFSNGSLIQSLNFEMSQPNLQWHSETRTISARTYPRLPGMNGSLEWFMAIYEWAPRELTINEQGLHLSFSNRWKQEYLAYFREFRNVRIGEGMWMPTAALAALVSTSDAVEICAGLKSPVFARLSSKELKVELDRVQGYGFPSFNPSICKGIK